MILKIFYKYSPNFNSTKRRAAQIKFLIFHYTGMKNETDAIKKLTNFKSNVSCHYFIKKKGEILLMVPDLYISWHAGKSKWKNYKSLNKYSIGIEISNPGHEFKYNKFTQKQINSILKLSKFLIKKYKIKSKCILGHSDISPDRKKDPGEKFPWNVLSKYKLSWGHKLDQDYLKQFRGKILSSKKAKNQFIKNLKKIGYNQKNKHNSKLQIKFLVIAFQRRFRQSLINGKIDEECLKISKSLLNS